MSGIGDFQGLSAELQEDLEKAREEISRLTRALADAQTVATLRGDLLKSMDAAAVTLEEQIKKERAARVEAEKLLAENHINHATCHECPCKINFDNYKRRAEAAEARSEAQQKHLERICGRSRLRCVAGCDGCVVCDPIKALRDGGKEEPNG